MNFIYMSIPSKAGAQIGDTEPGKTGMSGEKPLCE